VVVVVMVVVVVVEVVVVVMAAAAVVDAFTNATCFNNINPANTKTNDSLCTAQYTTSVYYKQQLIDAEQEVIVIRSGNRIKYAPKLTLWGKNWNFLDS
jgi:hypothetical protein